MLAKPGIKEDLANPMLASLAGHSSGKKTGVEANRGRGTGDRTKFIELRERLHLVGGVVFLIPSIGVRPQFLAWPSIKSM